MRRLSVFTGIFVLFVILTVNFNVVYARVGPLSIPGLDIEENDTTSKIYEEYRAFAVDGQLKNVERFTPKAEEDVRIVIFPEDFPSRVNKYEVIQALVYDEEKEFVVPGEQIVTDFFLLKMTPEVEERDSLVVTYDPQTKKISTTVTPDQKKGNGTSEIKQLIFFNPLGLTFIFAIALISGSMMRIKKRKLGLVLILLSGVLAVVFAIKLGPVAFTRSPLIIIMIIATSMFGVCIASMFPHGTALFIFTLILVAMHIVVTFMIIIPLEKVEIMPAVFFKMYTLNATFFLLLVFGISFLTRKKEIKKENTA
ncbi:MAG: hypothetical protein K9M12_01055 [Candidatus Pacebacteria bacterium]|nr:hypothetical protein [Candidatus Paceibacterota bacterium]